MSHAQPPPSGQPTPAKKKFPIWIFLVIGGVCLCGCLIFAAILIPVFSQAKESAQRAAGMANAKRLAMGVIMYTVDYDDHMPNQFSSIDNLEPIISPYVMSEWRVETNNPIPSFFLPNSNLAGVSYTRVEDVTETIMLLETEPWSNEKYITAFLDGHVESQNDNLNFDVLLSEPVDLDIETD